MQSLMKSAKIKLLICNSVCQYTRTLSHNYNNTDNNSKNKWHNYSKIVIGTAAAGFLGYCALDKRRKYVLAKAAKDEDKETAGKFKEGLPFYSLKEVSNHNSKETKVWVTYKEAVYDITDFVDKHPGGDQILIAAGSSLEPFWILYGVHENRNVYNILESYRIGNLNKEDIGALSSDLSDPYNKDPVRHAVLKPTSAKPFNAECPPSLLIESFLTPNDLFYVRNHLPVPDIDPKTYELEVELEGSDKVVTFTLDELKKLPKCTITAAIMCAGNRRGDMTKVKPVKGLNWGPAAVGNAKWTGVRLRDVLRKAGVNEDNSRYKHVQVMSKGVVLWSDKVIDKGFVIRGAIERFVLYITYLVLMRGQPARNRCCIMYTADNTLPRCIMNLILPLVTKPLSIRTGVDFDVTGKTYAASIPVWKALDKRGDVLLAYEMNGVPLPRDHGFPIRVVVPGVVGARNVKWLGKIIVSENESDSHWQQNDYKGFSPSTDWDTVDFTKSPAIQELPVISAICKPYHGDKVKVVDGHITVKGYAWSGGGQKIVRVDVTADGGKTWHVATFDCQDSADPPQHWAWTLWSAQIPIEKGRKEVEIWAKAVDSCYNTQPESFENIWNLRGVLGNAYHRNKTVPGGWMEPLVYCIQKGKFHHTTPNLLTLLSTRVSATKLSSSGDD